MYPGELQYMLLDDDSEPISGCFSPGISYCPAARSLRQQHSSLTSEQDTGPWAGIRIQANHCLLCRKGTQTRWHIVYFIQGPLSNIQHKDTNATRWSCRAIQRAFFSPLRSNENLLAGILCHIAKMLLWEILQNTICQMQQWLVGASTEILSR